MVNKFKLNIKAFDEMAKTMNKEELKEIMNHLDNYSGLFYLALPNQNKEEQR